MNLKDELSKERSMDSEIRFRQLANSLPIVVWTATPDGNLDFISDQWEIVYGNPIKESLGTGWGNYVHPQDRENAAKEWMHSLQTASKYETEFRVKCKDEYHWILVRALPIFNEKGELISWSGSNTNIQEKKLSEVAYKESEKLLISIVNNISQLAWMTDVKG